MKSTRFSRQSALVAVLTLLLVALIAGGGIYVWLLAGLPPIASVETRLVRPTTQILDRNGRLLYEIIDPDAGTQIDLRLDAIPPACIQATLSTEDSRFYLHPGVDPIAIGRAVWQNVNAGGQIVSGASTLTQQMARTLLMPPEQRYEQSLRRKLREAWLAMRLELRYTKDELLALYLNQSYYGHWAHGIEAAAQAFFAKPAAQLSRAECAVLAGLIQYPVGYSPLQYPDAAKERQLTVLRLMQEAGYLTAEERALVAAEPLRFRSNLFDIQAPHFVMYVQSLLADDLGSDRIRAGGLRVTTTLDLDLQRQAEAIVRRRLDQLNCRTPGVCDDLTDPNRRVDNAAAVVLDSQTGEILAMVGSPDYFDAAIQGNVNAALSLRQPGSAIKPLTYAAALDPAWSAEAGVAPLTPASIIADLPTTFYVRDDAGGNVPYAPQNYDRSFHGPVSVRAALANSYNIPAVKVLDRIGVESLQRIAAQAGISTFTDDYGLALTLGGGEVKLLELAAAYGILDDGRKLETSAISTIEEPRSQFEDRKAKSEERRTKSGQASNAGPTPLFALRSSRIDPHSSSQIIAPETAYLLTDILADATARMPAFGSRSVLDLSFPAAAKTGTTTDWRDNWTVGYSSERIVGVWVGNADNSPMLDVSGIDGAGPIWRDLMLAAHAQAPPPFSRPAAIVETTICAPSGLLPTPDCPRTRRERFIAGTEPTQADNQFRPVTIDLATGQAAGPGTPPERAAVRVFWHLSPEYHDWMVRQGLAVAPPNPMWDGESPQAERGAAFDLGRSLILAAPASNVVYQLHPGATRQQQRLAVRGRSGDGGAWHALRLVVDGQVLASVADVERVDAWWALAPGEHRIWLEGEPTPGAETIRSDAALVVVEPVADARARVEP